MTKFVKRTAVLGPLLAACIISLTLQPQPASGHNNNASDTATTWGEGTRINRSLPVKVALPPTGTAVIPVAVGRNDSCRITNDHFYDWRSDFAGHQGNGWFGILPYGSLKAGPMRPFMARSAKKGGGDNGDNGKDAICAYLYSVITYPNVNIVIKEYALSLYRSYGCQPAL